MTTSSGVADYQSFLKKIEDGVRRLKRETGAAFIWLEYFPQLATRGSKAGSTLTFGTKGDASPDIRQRFNDRDFLDRQIGELHIWKNGHEKIHDYHRVTEFVEWVCLRTYMHKNEVFSSEFRNLLRSNTTKQQIENHNYNSIAKAFNRILSTSGMAIWHICEQKRVGGKYQLAELDGEQSNEMAEKKLFLNVLGSHPRTRIDMDLDEGIASFVLSNSKILRIDDLLDPVEVAAKTNGRSVAHPDVVAAKFWRSGVFIPMAADNKILGVIGAYSPRVAGFNNLDQLNVERCTDQIAAMFAIHRASQKSAVLMEDITEVGKDVAAAQYSVRGSVHDVINVSRMIRDNFDLVTPTSPTKVFYDNTLSNIKQNQEILGRLRTNVQNPKKLNPKPTKILLREHVDDKLRSAIADAAAKKVKVENKIPESLEIISDEFRITQVMFNLITNSVRHFQGVNRTKGKLVTIAARKEGEYFEFSVEDNGQGIPKENQKMVFEPFFRTSGGMGLGLTIVKNFVEELGGEVSVSSIWGDGAVFVVRLPMILVT